MQPVPLFVRQVYVRSFHAAYPNISCALCQCSLYRPFPPPFFGFSAAPKKTSRKFQDFRFVPIDLFHWGRYNTGSGGNETQTQRGMEMATLAEMTDAELSELSATGTCWDRDHVRDERYRRQEAGNKRGRSVGDTVEFVRHGRPVAKSRNHRDGTIEDGMSVYLLDGTEVVYVGFWFDIATKPAYRGTGRIVGWGSDGEPLVVATEIRRDKRFDRK
jgi:hypothetical protein